MGSLAPVNSHLFPRVGSGRKREIYFLATSEKVFEANSLIEPWAWPAGHIGLLLISEAHFYDGMGRTKSIRITHFLCECTRP